ncbi:uncharacterized protein LOC133925466 [Phragmites australis]|uniref:uncharacterized protein LOC133925466 n=1 Tax=Phragmites australis TaxID=29695 RepID=UPI002D773E07|nr:uncharacterized protein LOC133925466 [Phragmites australis]
MGAMAIYSEPLLMSLSCHTDDDGSSSGGCTIACSCSADARRLHSWGEILAGGCGCGCGCGGGVPRGTHGNGGSGDTDTNLKRCEMAPGYVSFEDVIGTEAFREGSAGRPPEAGISDQLVRTASRLYAGEVAQPRHRRRSPGPLGTRRGSAMHGLVRKYVKPCFGFLASAFCCLG